MPRRLDDRSCAAATTPAGERFVDHPGHEEVTGVHEHPAGVDATDLGRHGDPQAQVIAQCGAGD